MWFAPFAANSSLPGAKQLRSRSLSWQRPSHPRIRHVQQYNNFRVGLSGAFYYLFGEGGQAFATVWPCPTGLGGDAVYQETLVSDQAAACLFFDGYRSLRARTSAIPG